MRRRMNGYLLAGLIVTGLMAALILVGLVWTPYDPDALMAGPKLEGPSLAHWLGTDSFGRDIFSRVLRGAGTTFLIALSTVAIGAVCGTAVGACTGYFGGVIDEVLMRFIAELPDGYRAVFNLYCIEEYSHREIAQMLGINEKSSSSQLFRARTLLARRIRDYLKTH